MRTVGVRFVADMSQYMSKLKAAGAATKDFAGQLDKTAKSGHLDKVADQALKVGVVGVAAFAGVVKSAADFDKQMSAVSAATHASSAEMGQLRAAALQAGKDTQFSATQAADGITQLSKAGVSTANILGGGLKGALDLAAAGQMDVGDAAEVASSAMTQFKLSGSAVPHIADLLAAGAGKAQGSVHDLSMALNMGGLVAAQMGLSIEDTTGTLAAFANAGLMGSDAGTSMKTMFLALLNPSSKASDLMQELGLRTYDASGKFVGITNFAGQLHDKLGKLTEQQRNSALATIFGSDAIRSASILYQQGASGIQGWIDKVNDAGYAQETAAKLTDNLAGDVERLKGSLETMAIQSGSGANSGLRVFTKGLNALVNQFLGMPSAVGSAITVLAGVTGALGLSLGGFIKLRRGIASAREELESMGPAGEKAATGLGKIAGAAGKVAGAFAALEIASAVLDRFRTDFTPHVDAATAGLNEFASTGKVTGEMARLAGGDIQDFAEKFAFLADKNNLNRSAVADLQPLLEGLVPAAANASNSLTHIAAATDAWDQALAGLVQGGQIGQAQVDFAALAKVLAVNGVTIDEVTAKFPQYAAALQAANGQTGKAAGMFSAVQGPMIGVTAASNGLSTAAKDAAGATSQAATATGQLGTAASGAKEKLTPFTAAQKAVTEAAKGQRTALKDLSSALEAQFNPVQALINAQKDFKTKQDAAKEAVHKYGSKSREARAASLELAGAALDLTGKVGDLGGSFDGKLSPAMRTALRNAGLTKGQIDDVAGAFKGAKTSGDKFAKDYQASVSIKGDKNVGQRLDRLRELQMELAAGKNISVANAMGKKGFGYATGGWTGPGPRMQVAGVVHADEYVVNKPARQRLEASRPGALDHMNRTGTWPGYAAGGLVWPFRTTAAMTRVPSRDEAISAVPAGRGYKWIEAIVRAAFPGMGVLSDYRPGARTLTGNVSYHALGRAVDFPPSRPLAEWFNAKYKSRIKELITPWQDLNILNGARHRYSDLIYNQHNFAGGNPHDHVAFDGPGWMPSSGGGGGNTYVTVQAGYVVTPQELENRIAYTLDRLRSKGRA